MMIESNKTKIVLEQHSQIKTFEFNYDPSTRELVQKMYFLCLAGGHDKDTVASAMYELGSQQAEGYDNG